MKSLDIKYPIHLEQTYAYISITNWNFEKLADKNGDLKVNVYKDGKLAGWGIANKKDWIRTCKLKEEKIVYRPDEPLKFYYNNLGFKKEPTEEEHLEELAKAGTF